jgi:peptide deformylase
MNLPIAKYGDPVLRVQGRRVEKVDDRVRELAANMLETMHAANGVGLAAQQVGEALQLTVLDVLQSEDRPSTLRLDGREIELLAAMPLILLNPKITLDDEINIGLEGCLSFPEITAEIERSVAVNVRAETLEGEPVEIEATGLLARALQHEVDHLNGILFIDRMSSVAKASLQSRLKRLRKETLRGEKNAARATQISL